jgi:hypothetical protein
MACAMLKAIQVLPTPRDAKIESLYSMDGDIAPAPEIVELAERHNALTYIALRGAFFPSSALPVAKR